MSPLRTLTGAWWHFWFTPAPASRLGAARLALLAPLALFYAFHDVSAWADVSPALWQPIWLFDRLHLPVLSAGWLTVLQSLWNVALATAAVGFCTRTSLWVVALLAPYLLGLPHNFGQTYHFDAALVIVFGILACSRAGDACSIDALIASARHGSAVPPEASGEYRWPSQLIVVTMSFVFVAAGIAKLWTSGVTWVFSDQMAILLERAQYHVSDADPLVSWGSTIAGIPGAARLLALATVVVETAYPLALFSRRLRVPLVLGGIGLLGGIRFLMGPTFEHFLLVNAFWVPWDRFGAWVRHTFAPARPAVVLYDGNCGLCTATAPVLRRLDVLGRLSVIDISHDAVPSALDLPPLDRDALLTTMHVITRDSRIVTGYDGYAMLAWQLPAAWLIAPFAPLPPVRAIGRRIYASIAAARHKRVCRVAPAPSAPLAGRSSL